MPPQLTTRFASTIFVFVLAINSNYTKPGIAKGKNGIPEQPKIFQKKHPASNCLYLMRTMTQENHLFLIKRLGIDKSGTAQNKIRLTISTAYGILMK
jgi:hypothetical protein